MKAISGIWLVLFIFLSACTKPSIDQEQPDNVITEEYLTTIRADTFINIGTTPDEIFNNLKNTRLQSQLLQYMKVRARRKFKVQQRDFDVFQIHEDIWTFDNKLAVVINYLVRHDTILYGLIESIDSSYTSIFGPRVFLEDEAMIGRHIDEHNAFYGTRKQKKDFLKEVIHTESRITIACGYGTGRLGKKEKAVFQAALAKDTAFLSGLLTSMNVEDQVRGVIGYKYIHLSGGQPSVWATQLMAHIAERNSTIYNCHDCTDKNQKTQPYVEKVSRFQKADVLVMLKERAISNEYWD